MSRHTIEDFNQQNFVKEIRDFMKKHGISTRRFAELTKSSPSTLPRIASGKTGITIETAQKFITAMKTFDA